MKALSIASILALAIAGTACSQASDPDSAKPEAETETVAAPETETSGFNLGLPSTVDSGGDSSASGFNLALPEASAAGTDGFNLETDLPTTDGLADIPEIETGLAEDAPEDAPEAPTDDEPVIRLD